MVAKLRSTPLALAVLGLLGVGPLHPYGIQRLMKLWGKDQVVNVGQRANLYRVINRLHEAGLIEVLQTERNQQFPERTVYALTDAGRQTGAAWMTEMLSNPRYEFPEFPAALSFAMQLEPDTLLDVLVQRSEVLRRQLARIEGELEESSGTVPRVAVLDTEYLRAVTAAELGWVDGVIDDLRSGALGWGEDLIDTAKSDIQRAGITDADLGPG